jgi:lysophospholipase L1-like esterase
LLLWDGTAAISAELTTNETAVCTTATKILTVSDSITLGDGSANRHGYRQLLFVDMRNTGHAVDLVGPYTNTISAGVDFDHGGNPGKGANIYAPKIANWLDSYQPDVVLLHIGTNDLTGNYTETARIESILDNIDQYEIDEGTAVPVILAQILNQVCQINDTNCHIRSVQTDELNANLTAMMLTRTDYNNNLILLNTEDNVGLVYEHAPVGDF